MGAKIHNTLAPKIHNSHWAKIHGAQKQNTKYRRPSCAFHASKDLNPICVFHIPKKQSTLDEMSRKKQSMLEEMSRENVGWCTGLNIDIRQNIWPTEAPHFADEPQNRFYFLRIRLVTNSWPISSAKSTRKEKQKIPLLRSHRKASKDMFFREVVP